MSNKFYHFNVYVPSEEISKEAVEGLIRNGFHNSKTPVEILYVEEFDRDEEDKLVFSMEKL